VAGALADIMYKEIIETIKSTIINYGTNNHLDNFWKEPLIEIIPATDINLAF
jgi:hypothetical protein